MKKSIILFILFYNFCALAQEIKPISKGFITVLTGQRMEFVNLRLEGNEVVFKNVATNSDFRYMKSSVRFIQDSNQQIIYGDPILVAKAEEDKKRMQEAEKLADTLFRPRYPDGIYKTKEDFILKKPSQIATVTAKGIIGFEKPILNTIEDNCFFFNTSNEKIKNVFAISYKGYLYFQIDAILSNRNKTDRAQTSDFPNSFVRVIKGGENYYYTEVALANQWAQGLAYGAGGIGGSVLAGTMVYGKGVVWDFKNKEFNIFKNCKDYNDFIIAIYPEGKQTCNNQQADVFQIRKAIDKIK
ncbi:MAG: hypothetical protein V4670_06635 [Bacteroidota bacterium]